MASMKVWYDKEGDILEVVFENVPASMEEIAEDIFERRTSDGRIVGFMVMNFSKHDQEALNIPFHVTAIATKYPPHLPPISPFVLVGGGIQCYALYICQPLSRNDDTATLRRKNRRTAQPAPATSQRGY